MEGDRGRRGGRIVDSETSQGGNGPAGTEGLAWPHLLLPEGKQMWCLTLTL